MLQNKVGYDIIQKIGGVSTIEEAQAVFEKQMDAVNLANIRKIKTADALLKIANAIIMGQPDNIFVNTGSEGDVARVKEMSLEKGEEAKLAMEQHTIHFDLAAEQGRIIDRTFYIANPGEEISSLANRMDRDDALKDVQEKMTGIMKGKTMVVGFYSRGPWVPRVPIRPLRLPVLCMCPTAPNSSTGMFLTTLTKKWRGRAISTPISIVKALIEPKTCPMPAFSWTAVFRPPTA